MLKLHEIPKAIEEALNSMMDEFGEISEDGSKLMDDLELNKKTKVLNIAKLIKSLEANAEATKKASEDMLKRSKSYANKANSWKGYLTYYAPCEEFEDAEISVKWSKSFVLPEYEIEKVPEEFKRVEKTIKVDGNELKKAIKEKRFLGFSLIEKNNIQIK